MSHLSCGDSLPLDLLHLPSSLQVKKNLSSLSFPGGSDGKESACNAGNPGQSWGQEDPLEKEVATLSSILAWEILWTEQPGGLQSMESQKNGTSLSTHTQE